MESSGLQLRQPEVVNDAKDERTAPNDADWGELHKNAKLRDSAELKVQDSEVDTLLVFAGLFSAILTAFIIDVYKDLKIDSNDMSADILHRILLLLQEGQQSPAALAELPPLKAQPSRMLTTVISLWFVSLILSLASALACIFMKQWLHAYNKWAEPSSFKDSLVLRGFYKLGLRNWHLYAIFTSLGVLLQIALVFFAVGLVGYLWTLTLVVSPTVTLLVVVMIASSFSTLLLPLRLEDCPYKFPSSHWVDRDLPVARRVYGSWGPPSAKAVNETALVLDIPPSVIEDALEDGSNASENRTTAARTAMYTVQTRVRQLSASSMQLLIAVLSNDDLLAAHKQGFEVQPFGLDMRQKPGPATAFDSSRLLRLWHLVFLAMENPPAVLARPLGHLAETLGTDRYSELQHADLLAEMLNHCGTLSKEGKLPATGLSDYALSVHVWSRSSTGAPPGFAALVSLRALYYATTHIPESVMTKVPENGLSPVTPYLELLRALQTGIAEARTLDAVKHQPMWTKRIAHGDELLETLTKRHDSFLCTRGRGFYPLTGVTAEPRSGVFSQDCSRLYIGSDEAEAWVLDLKSEVSEILTPSTLPSGAAFRFATFSRDGRWIVWGSREGRVLAVDTSVTPPRQHPLDNLIRGKNAHPIAVSWDNNHAVFGSEDSWADVVDLGAAEVIMSFEEHTQRLCRAAFAPKPLNLVATSSFDNTVKVWDIFDGVCMQTFDALNHSVNGVAWSPDGNLIAISSMKAILVFEWRTGELRATFEGHTKLVTALSFSPNSRLLASCANDHAVRVWSVDKKSCIATLTGPADDVNWVGFSPDGAYITCAADNSVWVWDINPKCMYPVV